MQSRIIVNRVIRSAEAGLIMNIEFVTLLQVQRDLYSIPRGPERFSAYLKAMVNSDGTDVRLAPLVAMNPMGKDHVPTLLDTLLAMEAEAIAARATAEATPLVMVHRATSNWGCGRG